MTERSRTPWTAHKPPACWDNPDSWVDWINFRQGAVAPCRDCSQKFKNKMKASGRCERPETVFVEDGANFEVVGICADDPGFARVLRGESLGKHIQPVGEWVEENEAWARVLLMARKRANSLVKGAIDEFVRKVRGAASVERNPSRPI